MNEPVLIKRSFLIALMVCAQTLTPPLIAAASLFAIKRGWNISFANAPATFTVVAILIFLVLMRPPRSLSSQLRWKPAAGALGAGLQWLLLLAVLLLIGYATDVLHHFPPRAILTWALVTPLFLILGTLCTRRLMRHLVMTAVSARKVIFAGYNRSSLHLARRLERDPALRLDVVGFFDDRGTERLNMEIDTRLVGRLSDLATFARERSVDVIFIALPMRHVKRVLDLLDDLRDTTASIYYMPDIFVFDLIQSRSSDLSGVPVVALCETPFYGYRGIAKRLIDVSLATLFLIGASPLLLAIAALVKLSSPGPAIFRQRRYGLDGQEIIVYKYRTMTVTEDGVNVMQASRDDPRTTPFGRMLRRYSLDELPQFINVLQGRMSVVGPRPHAVAHNELYRKLIKGYMVRHKVLPGITGLAQISGARGETVTVQQMEERVKYDLDYLRHWSPMLDFKIIVLTVVKLFGDDKAF
jgi:putative colanic acid biosysnthesis UDP-glucose lipid carrier transferase